MSFCRRRRLSSRAGTGARSPSAGSARPPPGTPAARLRGAVEAIRFSEKRPCKRLPSSASLNSRKSTAKDCVQNGPALSVTGRGGIRPATETNRDDKGDATTAPARNGSLCVRWRLLAKRDGDVLGEGVRARAQAVMQTEITGPVGAVLREQGGEGAVRERRLARVAREDKIMSTILAGGLPRVRIRTTVLLAVFVLHASIVSAQVVPPPRTARGPAEVPGVYIVTLRQGVPASERSAIVQETALAHAPISTVPMPCPWKFPTRPFWRGCATTLASVLSMPTTSSICPPTALQACARRAQVQLAAGPTVLHSLTAPALPLQTVRRWCPPVWTRNWSRAGEADVDRRRDRRGGGGHWLDFAHPDLGLPAEVVGVNSFNALGGSCQDIHGHGTHVAGIIAARNNPIGVVGVAPDAALYCVNVFQPDPTYEVVATDESLIAGLQWIADHANQVSPPIRVVNMSLGRPSTPDDTRTTRCT